MEENQFLNKMIKGVNSALGWVFLIFLIGLAGCGFVFGVISLGLWFIENTGEFPQLLIHVLNVFDFFMYLMIFLLIFFAYLWIVKKVFLPAMDKAKIRKEKKVLFYQQRMAKLIAQEIKKTNQKKRK